MKYKMLALDIETTGLDMEEDEILQISLVDDKGKTVFTSYTKPKHHTEWPEAEEVNHISPEFVEYKPTFSEIKPIVQKIIDSTELLITYNGKTFDIPFLINNGIDFTKLAHHGRLKHADVCEIAMCTMNKGYDFEKNRPIYMRLAELAESYDIRGDRLHDSEYDATATMLLYLYFKNGRQPYTEDKLPGDYMDEMIKEKEDA